MAHHKPLTVTLSASVGALVREHAQAQGVTYESLVEACVRQGCASGGPVVLEPWGVVEAGKAVVDSRRSGKQEVGR